MAYLEFETIEIARIAKELNRKESISNFKGLPNGISFTVERKVLMIVKLIKLKIVFVSFENEKIIFEISPNDENKVFEFGFDFIKDYLSNFISNDSLPDGIEIKNNFLYVNPAQIVKSNDLTINVSEVFIESGKLRLIFELLKKR